MVDYKKWDKFLADLSSDDDEQEKRQPRITTLPSSSGGKVTIGPNGYKVHDDYVDRDNDAWNEDEEADTMPKPQSLSYEQSTLNRIEGIEESIRSKKQNHKSTVNGSEGTVFGCNYYWSQTRYEVHVCISLANGMHDYSKRNLYIYYDEIQKRISLFHSLTWSKDVFFRKFKEINYDVDQIHRFEPITVMFTAKLQYAIQLVGDTQNPYDEPIDWDLIKEKDFLGKECSYRMEMVLKKLCPIPNATLWWEKVFIGEPKIDVTTIAGRTNGAPSHSKDNYQQAHELFLQRIRDQKKMEVDIDREDES